MKLVWSENEYVATDPNDTGLRFTDVLFGFALREVVLRMAKWNVLTDACKIHLGLATVTILGSYIGFRNSEKRGKFTLRFFNLATIRFALDQGMVFLYFWLALYFSTDKDPKTGHITLPTSGAFLRFESRVVFAIFVLYLAWDLMSHWMEHTDKYILERSVSRDGNGVETKTDKKLEVPKYRTVITLGGALVSGGSLILVEANQPGDMVARGWMLGLVIVVIGYRVCKDVIQKS